MSFKDGYPSSFSMDFLGVSVDCCTASREEHDAAEQYDSSDDADGVDESDE